jgi:hypothetical protein
MLLPKLFLFHADIDLIPSDSGSSKTKTEYVTKETPVNKGDFVKNAVFPSIQRYVTGHTTT